MNEPLEHNNVTLEQLIKYAADTYQPVRVIHTTYMDDIAIGDEVRSSCLKVTADSKTVELSLKEAGFKITRSSEFGKIDIWEI